MNIITLMPLIFLFGYVFKVTYKDLSNTFIKIIITLFVPVLIIFLFQGLVIDQSTYHVIMLGHITFITGAIIAIIISATLKLDKRSSSALILAMSFGNTSFLGIPYIHSYYGSEGLKYLAFFDILGTSVPIFIVGAILNSYCNNHKINIMLLIKIVLKPQILAMFVGFYLRDVQIPTNIYNVMSFMASSIGPLAIFTIGMRFSLKAFKDELPTISGILLVKMLIVPAVITLIVYFVFNMNDIEYKVSIIESALPPMISASALAIQYNFRGSLVVGAVTLGALVSFVTTPLLHYLIT